MDNPYIATVIWGGPTAENRWENLSVNEFSKDTFKIYPNPVQGNLLTIENKQNTTYEIYNVLGKKVLKGNITPSDNKVNVSNLSKGVYILKLQSKNGTVTKKLIKE
nr:T9SS type A sorting domain-containing protein [uncultured Lacinutrix sp.]